MENSLVLTALSVLSTIRADMLDAPRGMLAWFNETLFTMLSAIEAPDDDKRWNLAITIGKAGKSGAFRYRKGENEFGQIVGEEVERYANGKIRYTIDKVKPDFTAFYEADFHAASVENTPPEVGIDYDNQSMLRLLLADKVTREVGKITLIARYVRSGLFDFAAIRGKEVITVCKGKGYSSILAEFAHDKKLQEEARNMLDFLASAADSKAKLVEEGYLTDSRAEKDNETALSGDKWA